MPTTFSIDLTVLTKDKLRKIQFKLVKALIIDEKDEDADKITDETMVKWTLVFSLNERKKETDAFGEEALVSLAINISKQLEQKSEATLKEGFDAAQRSAAMVAADKYKLWASNKISKTSFLNSLNSVIARRGA